MRLHIIIDPEGKIDNKLPEDLVQKFNIRTAAVEVADGLSFNQRERIIAQIIRMVLEEPEAE